MFPVIGNVAQTSTKGLPRSRDSWYVGTSSPFRDRPSKKFFCFQWPLISFWLYLIMCSDCTIRLGATMNEILLITEWSRWHCVYFPDIICEVHRRGFLWWRLLTLLIVWQTTICVWCRQLFSFFFFVCDEDLTLFIVWQTTISCFGWIMFKCKVHRCQYLGEDWQFCVHLQSPQILVSVVKVNKWRFSSWKSDLGNYLFFCRHWLITAFARQQLITRIAGLWKSIEVPHE